jgi:hypothetical protein
MSSQPFFRVLQMLTRWALAVGWIAVTLLATTMLFFGNFVVAWQAFVLMGFEPEPLSQIPMLGPIAVAAGIGKAQLASLYAAALTAAMAVTVISACKFGNDALTLFFDMRQTRLEDAVSPVAVIRLWETVAAFAVAAVLAGVVARYDVALFSLRLEALVTGMNDVKESVHWLPDSVARLGGYLAEFAARAQWGYLAVIAGVAYTTEKAFQRASERWLVIGQTIDAVILAPSATQPAAGATPLLPARAPVGEPAPGIVEPPVGVPPPFAPPDVEEPTPYTPGAPAAPFVEPAPQPPAYGPVGPGPSQEPHRGPRVRVICGPGETREVPLHEVERDPAQYVRDGSGRAWFLRTYYDELYGATPQRDGQSLDHEDPENVQNMEAHSHV